jgi:hypothetical protein
MSTTVIRCDFAASTDSLRHAVGASITDMETSVAALRNDLERLELRLTLRLGGMFAVSVAILSAIIKL